MYCTSCRQVIANQLQVVCRQLRHETRTLGILYNTINFYRDLALVSNFIESIPLRVHYRHTDLRLRILDVDWSRSTKEQLSTIDETYPCSTLNYYHCGLDSREPSPLIHMVLW